MKKSELSDILHACFDHVSDSITSVDDFNKTPRCVYWDYLWDYIEAGGDAYEDIRTYQVSIFAKVPPNVNGNLNRLRQLLKDACIFPVISHEYLKEQGEWHSFFSVEVIHDND